MEMHPRANWPGSLSDLGRLTGENRPQRGQFLPDLQAHSQYREIVRALAELAAHNNDSEVKSVLQKHGITYPPKAPAGSPAVAATPARK